MLLRMAGQGLFRPAHWTQSVVLFAVSFPLMGWVVRGRCRAAGLPREQWPSGAMAVVLPTLLLDPVSCVFFPVVFPNIQPSAVGLFGGWILWCCAGAFVGVALRR